MTERVGIVGMGLMGQAFIHNMRKSQFFVQGFDVDPARMDDLTEQGGHPVDTPAAAARDVDCVIASLPTSDIAREVPPLGRPKGFISATPPPRARKIPSASMPTSPRAASAI